jgi:hypothetical protein
MAERLTDPRLDKVPRKKRRWWLYVLIGCAGLFLLGVVGLIGVGAYWNSLIKTYTQTQPKPLPALEVAEGSADAVEARWKAFLKDLAAGKQPPPFELSADDINAFLESKARQLVERARVVINGDKLQARFSVPLGQRGEKSLQGRFLNGVATFHLSFADGWPDLRVATVEANGKPLPGWLLRRVQRLDLLRDLSNSSAFVEVLPDIESIRVEDGLVVIRPLPPE